MIFYQISIYCVCKILRARLCCTLICDFGRVYKIRRFYHVRNTDSSIERCLAVVFDYEAAIQCFLLSGYYGYFCWSPLGLSLAEAISLTTTKLGASISGIAVVIGLAVVSGQIMDESGAAEKIARSILKTYRARKGSVCHDWHRLFAFHTSFFRYFILFTNSHCQSAGFV